MWRKIFRKKNVLSKSTAKYAPCTTQSFYFFHKSFQLHEYALKKCSNICIEHNTFHLSEITFISKLKKNRWYGYKYFLVLILFSFILQVRQRPSHQIEMDDLCSSRYVPKYLTGNTAAARCTMSSRYDTVRGLIFSFHSNMSTIFSLFAFFPPTSLSVCLM